MDKTGNVIRELTEQQSLYIKEFLIKSHDTIFDFMDKSRNSKTIDIPGVGWIEYEIIDDVFWIWTAYSKAEHSVTKIIWNKLIEKAKQNDCDRIQFVTSRNPKAFERLFNVKPVQYKLEFRLEKEN